MRLPRRHPFASHGGQAEVSHLYSLFYPSPAVPHYEADAQRAHGVHLVQSLYLAKGGCPVAIECTSSLVSSLLLDHQLTGYGARGAAALTPPPAISLAVRQTLTLSLIRLVNTLADSLQKGAFARSIASIAERDLGLPQWFVEFRHRGTHEELPSLEICREVVGSALAWIEGAYWLPTLRDAERRRARALDRRRQGSATDLTDAFQSPGKHEEQLARTQAGSGSALLFPSSTSQAASSSVTAAEKLQQHHLPALRGILRNYKRLSKLLVRDESLRGRSRADMQGIYRDLDNWIRAARRDVGEGYRTMALGKGMNQSVSGRRVGWANEEEDDSDSEQDEDSRGQPSRRNARSADPTLECLIGVLLSSSEGVGLIPLSKSKRAKRARSQEEGGAGEGLPTLPEELLLAWSGLLNHLGRDEQAGEINFIEIWLESMIEPLLGTSTSTRGNLEESASSQMDGSSRLTLLAWIKFILDSLSFTSAPASGPPASAHDEVTSLRACIRVHLLSSSSKGDRKQDTQSFLLSLAEKLLLHRGVSSTSHSQTQAQAQAQASLAVLLRDVTARLDEATRGRLQSLVELLPPYRLLPEEERDGDDGEEGARKKRRLPAAAELIGEGQGGRDEEDSFPLLSGFEDMDSGALSPPPAARVPLAGGPSSAADSGREVNAGEGGGAGEVTLMEEMERRWRQVLASSSSSSSSSATPATAAPAAPREPLPVEASFSQSSAATAIDPSTSPLIKITPPPPSSIEIGLEPSAAPAPTSVVPPAPAATEVPSAATAASTPPLPTGWSLFPVEEWRATPIGMIRLGTSTSTSSGRGHERKQGEEEETEGGVGRRDAEGEVEEGGGRAIVPDFMGLFAAGGGGGGAREEMAL